MGLEYEEVQVIHSVISNRYKIQIIEDYHNILRERLCEVLEVYLNFKIVNINYINIEKLKK
jgi:hypothetical protein